MAGENKLASHPSPSLINTHLERIEQIHDRDSTKLSWAGRYYRKALGRIFRHIIPTGSSVLEIGCGDGTLLTELPERSVTGIDISRKMIERAGTKLPQGRFIHGSGEMLRVDGEYDFVVISDTLNFAADAQAILDNCHGASHDRTRIVINFQNQLWKPVMKFASMIGLRHAEYEENWLSSQDIKNLLLLSGWDIVTQRPAILMPFPLFGIDRLVNRYVAPLFPHFCLSSIVTARSQKQCTDGMQPSVSVLIPARNESGNIKAALDRTPMMGSWTEIIFVEGNSTDDTWQEILRQKDLYPHLRIKTLQQTGKGKGNAVRDGFAIAEGDILMILDADLTMPPEELNKFYNAVASGKADFANGSRLVYPMEEKAMQFLNMCANKVFGILFSWMLGQPVRDTLCGTKVLRREDYNRIVSQRKYFGDFDPFGDFDLLFGAAKQNLRILDIPIRYKERTYGSTNIHRWKHGLLLLRMVLFAARRIKFIG